MLENTNIKQFYPGPILNSTLEITEFLFKNPEQVKITHTYLDEDGILKDKQLTYGTDYEVEKTLPSDVAKTDANLTASVGQIKLKNTVSVLQGETLTVYRESEIVQEISYPRTGPFPAATHEGALDYLTMQNQEQQDQIDRSLKVPISTQNFLGQLPVPEPAKALKINADGTGFEMSEYDPDTALVTTKEYMEGAQNAANAALASQSAAAASASNAANSASSAQTIITTGQTSINNAVTQGTQTIDGKVTQAQQNIQSISGEAVEDINEAIEGLETYLNNNPFSGKSIGEFFWTFRTDEINGAYKCNGQEFLASLFSGDNNPYDLLVAGKLPVKTYEEYQQELEANNGVCGYFGLDTTNQKFKLPKMPVISRTLIRRGSKNIASNSQDYNLYSDGYLEVYGHSSIQEGVNTITFIKSFELASSSRDIRITMTRNATATTTSFPTYFTRDISGTGFEIYSSSSTGINWMASGYTIPPAKSDWEISEVKNLYPMVQLVTSATEVSFADYATQFTTALNEAMQTLSASGQEYLQDLTPNQFIKFADKRRLTIAKNTFIKLDVESIAQTLWYINSSDLEFEAESLLDSGATFQAGKAYSIFLVPNASNTAAELKISLNSTAPTGYTPGDTRRIGGFHTLCVDAGNITWHANHPLSGFVAGDILPQSVWTLYHRPYASPNNCIYIPCGIPFWRTIYDHAGTLATTSFEYGGTVTRSRTFYGHMQDMMHAGYILPTYEQAAISAYGCEPLKAVMGKAEASVTTAGGHVNESNHRIVSIYGAEDGVGVTWKISTIGAIGGSGWATDSSVGVHQYGSVNVLLVGGNWGNSGYAGPFATSGYDSALTANSDVASFGVSYPLPRKSVGIA